MSLFDVFGKNKIEDLINSCRLGRNAEIKTILEKNHNLVNGEDTRGLMPLMVAAFNGLEDTVELLLKAGANPDIQNKEGMTALMVAANNGKENTVELLLKAGANPNIQNKIGLTALMGAADKGRTNIAEMLIKAGADPNIQTYKDGWTALMSATSFGHKDTVELLLKAGADPKKRMSDGLTPLKASIIKGYGEISMLLERYGASGDMHETVEEPPTVKKADTNIPDNNKNLSLADVACLSDTSRAESLIKSGADINAQDENGWTPLMHAIYYENTGMVELLVKAGANVNIQSKDGRTALSLAAESVSIKIRCALGIDTGVEPAINRF